MPGMLRNVSCCPANDASGRSSAVADDRTAKEASAFSATSSPYARGSRPPARAGSGWSTIGRPHLLAHPARRIDVVGVQALEQRLDLVDRPSRHEAAVRVGRRGEPVGTRTPAEARFPIISPSDEFFPPTSSRSSIPISRTTSTFAVMSRLLGLLGSVRDSPVRVCMMTVAISSTDLVAELMTGRRLAARHRLVAAELLGALLQRGVGSWGARLAHLDSRAGRRGDARRPVPQVPHRPRQLGGLAGPPRPAGSSRRTGRAAAPGTSSSASCRTATARCSTTSALSSARRLCPSSCSMAYSIAAIRAL